MESQNNFKLNHSIFLDSIETDNKQTVSGIIYEKATALLLKGLQTSLFEYGYNDTVSNSTIPLAVAKNIYDGSDDNKLDNEHTYDSITDETKINFGDDDDDDAFVDPNFNVYLYDTNTNNLTAVSLDQSFNGTNENQTNIEDTSLPIPFSHIFHKVINSIHRNNNAAKNFVKPHITDSDDSYGYLVTDPIYVNSQKGSSERSPEFDIDVRFNTGNDQVEQATQRQLLDQQDSASQKFQYSAQAYHYTTIENRPPVTYTLPHPPLQDEYPKAIQNNYVPKAQLAYQTSAQQYAPLSVPIPSSLPSIVHRPDPTPIRSIVNRPPVAASAPARPAGSASPPQPQYFSSPVITSTYSNRDTYGQAQNSDVQEKVVVKIVPATGWYLNDEKERQSYYNAVSQGLLSENGYVFVNDVQRVSGQSSPCETSNPTVPCSTSNNAPSLPQYPFHPQYTPTQPPWLHRYREQLPDPRHTSTEIRSTRQDEALKGKTSYNVPLMSVGKLAGDSDRINNYSLSSLYGGSIGSPRSNQ